MGIHKNAWFINFAGIGNGIVVAPILRCFEKRYPQTNYFHTDNGVLSDTWFVHKAGLHNLKGFSSVDWRRFSPEYLDSIINFISDNNIDLIVNLRNEGPKYDVGYYEFKKMVARTSITFFDLDFENIEIRKTQHTLTDDILVMLRQHSISLDSYNSHWLASPTSQQNGVGFGMAASQTNKRWPTAKWINLAKKIQDVTNEYIILFPGTLIEDLNQAELVAKALNPSRCEIVYHKPLKDVTGRIQRLKCFVSNDTGLLHISAATTVYTIGIYVCTDATVWSPYNKTNFTAFQNSLFIEKCPARKIHCGNCFHYYDPCPAITNTVDNIDPAKIFSLVKKTL